MLPHCRVDALVRGTVVTGFSSTRIFLVSRRAATSHRTRCGPDSGRGLRNAWREVDAPSISMPALSRNAGT